MDRKLIFAAIVLACAALSPAPINDARVKHKIEPERSQDQVAKEQVYNGVVPVVGQVPRVVNEAGMETVRHRMGSDDKGAASLKLGTEKADKVGGTAISQASNRVEQEEHGSKFGWLIGLLIAAAGFGGWKLVQYKIEKSTPVPEFSRRFLKEINDGKI